MMSDLSDMLKHRHGVKPFKKWILLIALLAKRKERKEIERQQRTLK